MRHDFSLLISLLLTRRLSTSPFPGALRARAKNSHVFTSGESERAKFFISARCAMRSSFAHQREGTDHCSWVVCERVRDAASRESAAFPIHSSVGSDACAERHDKYWKRGQKVCQTIRTCPAFFAIVSEWRIREQYPLGTRRETSSLLRRFAVNKNPRHKRVARAVGVSTNCRSIQTYFARV